MPVRRNTCDCGRWRPKNASLINHGQAAEDQFVAKGATAAPVVLNRQEVVGRGAGLGLRDPEVEGLHPTRSMDEPLVPENQEEVVEAEDDEMGVPPQVEEVVMDPTSTGTAAMEVNEPEPESTYLSPTTKAPGIPSKAYPGKAKWSPPPPSHLAMSTTSTPVSYSPGDFSTESTSEPGHSLTGTGATASGSPGPDPVPKKARGPVGEVQQLAIVLPNGEALWFTTRDLSAETPRLVIPWSLFQYMAMSRRSLSGFQSWGKVDARYIRRVAQDILHNAQQRGPILERIREANRSNPLLMDLASAYPEPQNAATPMSASTGTHRPNFNFRDFLQRPSLGSHFGPGEGPPRFGRGSLPCVYDSPTHEMPLAASLGEADHAMSCMGLWAQRLLGQESPIPPPTKSAPPKATSSATTSIPTAGPAAPTAEPATEEVDEEEDFDVELTAEEKAEVARIEEECAALERRMRDLSAIQQTTLLENLANVSSAVLGGLLADTVRRTAQMRGKGAKGAGRQRVKATQASANNDPKYLEDLSRGLSHTEAFIRHRSRLRAIQHQMEYGEVSLQPRATQVHTDRPLPPMLSLGRAHRQGLLDRLARLEQQGVSWTQEEVDRCLTMEQFLDYLEDRESHRPAESAEAPGTASKAAGAPPSRGPTTTGPAGEQSTSTRQNPTATSTTPEPEEDMENSSSATPAPGDPPSENSRGMPSSTGPSSTSPSTTTAAGRPVEHVEGNDPPEDQPSTTTVTSEPAESRGREAPSAGAPLPPTNAARHAEAGRFFL